MKKTLIVLGCLSLTMAHAQQDYEKRVGINTDKPRASLEVRAVEFNGITQGILFPHIDENEKATWTTDNDKGLVAGTVIWNTTKLCLDYFDGTKWTCTDGTKSNVHPTPWTPGATSFTGTAVWGDDAGENIDATKNDCPAGQTGSKVTYPANTAQHITYTATSTVSQEDANQKAIELMNSAQKQQERQTLAQEYANQNGTCKNDLPNNDDVKLPDGVTIANGEHWIASILDNSYLPYTLPDAPASWTERTNPNAGTDQNIDVKGQIPAQGITVQIPINVTSGSPTLPAYKAYVTTVPEAWKDGQAKVLELSWETQTLSTTTKTITATIKVKDANTNQELTQLDLRNGLGNDYKGILLGQFKMPKNQNETTGTTYTGTYDVRVISGILDKKFSDKTRNQQGVEGYHHRLIYIPVTGPDGKLWLNNNIGAEYNDLNSPNFNPAKQAESPDDPKAVGDLVDINNSGHQRVRGVWGDIGHGPIQLDDPKNTTVTINEAICPDGWRIPKTSDWDQYTMAVTGSNIKYNRLPLRLQWNDDPLKLLPLSVVSSTEMYTLRRYQDYFNYNDTRYFINNWEPFTSDVYLGNDTTYWNEERSTIRCIKN